MQVYIGCFLYTNKECIALYLYLITNSWIERNQSKILYEIIFKRAQQFNERTEKSVIQIIHIFTCKLQMILQSTFSFPTPPYASATMKRKWRRSQVLYSLSIQLELKLLIAV